MLRSIQWAAAIELISTVRLSASLTSMHVCHIKETPIRSFNCTYPTRCDQCRVLHTSVVLYRVVRNRKSWIGIWTSCLCSSNTRSRRLTSNCYKRHARIEFDEHAQCVINTPFLWMYGLHDDGWKSYKDGNFCHLFGLIVAKSHKLRWCILAGTFVS